MSGRSCFSWRARISSRQIASLAVADPPGTVDAHDDRAQRGVLAGLANRLDQRFRADRLAVEWVEAALSADDRAGGVDHGHTRSAVQAQRRQAHARVVGGIKRRHVRPSRVAQLLHHLILVCHLVDQPCTSSASSARNGPSSTSVAHFGVGLVPRLGYRADDLLEQIPVEPFVHLACGPGCMSFRCKC